MQSSSEIHHHERCRPVFPTENTGPADSDKGKVRRRVMGKSSAPQICRQQSFGRDIGHAAAETYLITRLSFDLLGYLGYVFQFSLPHSHGYTHKMSSDSEYLVRQGIVNLLL